MQNKIVTTFCLLACLALQTSAYAKGVCSASTDQCVDGNGQPLKETTICNSTVCNTGTWCVKANDACPPENIESVPPSHGF